MRIVLVGLCVASMALSACSKRDASQDDAARSDSAVVASAAGPPIVVRAAGVRFATPSTWPSERYRVEAKSGEGAYTEQAGASHWVAVHYRPEEPAHNEASLCRIVVFSHDTWARIDAEGGPPLGTLIETAGGWVYVAQLPQANPYSTDSSDGKQFDSMRLSIRDLRARFVIEGDGPDASATPSETGEL